MVLEFSFKYKDYEIDFEKVISNYKQKKKDECINKYLI